MAQRDLVESLLLSPPSVTRMLQRMERAGLVERSVDPQDQRQAVVRLTGSGRELADLVQGALAEFLERSLAALPDVDRRELARLLRAWCEAGADVEPAATIAPVGPAATIAPVEEEIR
jgi:DNA-binding MarR family transcriptional regulator